MEPITFETEDGLELEGEIRVDGEPRGPAVVCHAHPLHGGSKDHPLLWALRIELAHKGFAVLTFNFRGVMGSQGEFGGGLEEVADVRAAVERAQREAPGRAFVAGWSFGAHTALRAAVDDPRVGALGLIGMPLAPTPDPPPPPLPPEWRLRRFDRPVLLMAGDADPYCPVPALEDLGRVLPGSTVRVIAGTGHYFGRREREAAAVMAAFAADALSEG